MSAFTKVVSKMCYDEINSFYRWANTFMKKNTNKNKLLNLLYNFQEFAKDLSYKYDNTNSDYEIVSYDIYLAAVYVRKFIDNYHLMIDGEQDNWTHMYDDGYENDGLDMCGNKWVTDKEMNF
jgi:hypothetical protein